MICVVKVIDTILVLQYAKLKKVKVVNSKAESYSLEGFNCCQSVFVANAESLGVSKELALKITSGMGAGMGRMQETCGAVTGACLFLGLRYGYSDAADTQSKERTYGFVQDLHRRFADIHGTTNCRELLGLDMRSEEGRKKF